jgi:hypothetical protein
MMRRINEEFRVKSFKVHGSRRCTGIKEDAPSPQPSPPVGGEGEGKSQRQRWL